MWIAKQPRSRLQNPECERPTVYKVDRIQNTEYRIQNAQWLMILGGFSRRASPAAVGPISDEPEKEADAHPSGERRDGRQLWSDPRVTLSEGNLGVQNEIWWAIWVDLGCS